MESGELLRSVGLTISLAGDARREIVAETAIEVLNDSHVGGDGGVDRSLDTYDSQSACATQLSGNRQTRRGRSGRGQAFANDLDYRAWSKSIDDCGAEGSYRQLHRGLR